MDLLLKNSPEKRIDPLLILLDLTENDLVGLQDHFNYLDNLRTMDESTYQSLFEIAHGSYALAVKKTKSLAKKPFEIRREFYEKLVKNGIREKFPGKDKQSYATIGICSLVMVYIDTIENNDIELIESTIKQIGMKKKLLC